MSEPKQTQLKLMLLVAIVLLLITFIGMQAWYMVDMKKQLNEIQSQNYSTGAPAQNVATKDDGIARSDNNDLSDKSPSDLQNKQKPANRSVIPDIPPPLFDDDFFNSPYDSQTWNPYEEIQRMQRNMDRMFNNTFNNFNNSPDFHHFFRQGNSVPQVDLREDDNQYTIIVNLPGTDKGDISVSLEGQTLTIKGEQNFENQQNDAMGDTLFQERRSGAFQRSITLPEPVRQNGMDTRVDNGVLTIVIPKDK